MIGLAISILWLCIGIIILLGCVWIALYVVKLFCAVPDPVEKAIWAICLLLCLIGALTLLAGVAATYTFQESGRYESQVPPIPPDRMEPPSICRGC